MFNIFSKNSIGLDIGSKNIKIVYLTSKHKKFKVASFKILPLPLEIVGEEVPIETKITVIEQVIKNFFSKYKNLPKRSAISVSGSSVVIRYIKLPIMKKEEIEKTIYIEAEPFIPFPITDVYLSFDIIGEVIDENIKKNEVVIVAAKKDYIDAKIKMLRNCRIKPVYIGVDIFVLEEVLKYNYEVKEEVVCVVNIGHNITNVGVIENGVTRITRDLPLGIGNIINNIKKSLQQQKQISDEELMVYLKEDGLIITEEDKEKYLKDDKKIELLISKSLISSFKEISSEIHKIIDFYYFQKGEQKMLSKILLSGGGSIIKNLNLYLYNEFKVDVEYLDPFKNIENSENIPQELRPIFAVAVGLAMKQ